MRCYHELSNFSHSWAVLLLSITVATAFFLQFSWNSSPKQNGSMKPLSMHSHSNTADTNRISLYLWKELLVSKKIVHTTKSTRHRMIERNLAKFQVLPPRLTIHFVSENRLFMFGYL